MHNTEKIFFDENEEWYKMEVLKTLAAIKESRAIVEVNTRGSYKGKTADYYPSNWILKEIKDMSIPITISSDAHRVEEIILKFPEVVRTLASLGFTEKMILNNGEWKAVAL
jgi:histidinol-phosphatase (PHP family)